METENHNGLECLVCSVNENRKKKSKKKRLAKRKKTRNVVSDAQQSDLISTNLTRANCCSERDFRI